MKNLFFLLLLCWNTLFFGQNQKIIATKIDSIDFVTQNFIGIDSYGNYFYENENVLYKKTPTSTIQYQNVSLGKIKKIDIINPLKIVVFHENFNTVVLLDNQLNEIQKVDFSNPEIADEKSILVTATGLSGQNKLWFFNANEQQIGLYDFGTQKIKNLGIPLQQSLTYYQTDFNTFQWIDSQNNWYSCSIFGEISFKEKTDLFDEIQFLDNSNLIYSKENVVFFKNRKTNQLYKIEIVEKSFKKFYYNDQILTIFTDRGITNYKITLP
jgi:hypothetical protein